MAWAKDGAQELGLNNRCSELFQGLKPTQIQESWPFQPPSPYRAMPKACQGVKSIKVPSPGRGWANTAFPEADGKVKWTERLPDRLTLVRQ